ncbi:hypothetical protein EDC01DRAFT_632861 [Geopyxis carbonaria]|nr:hypothetical protein EDC01DRAFT_632861 [Geopyxis carbonaria]
MPHAQSPRAHQAPISIATHNSTLRVLSWQLSGLSREGGPDPVAEILRIGQQFQTLLDGPVQALLRFPWPPESAEAEAEATLFLGRVDDFRKRLGEKRSEFGVFWNPPEPPAQQAPDPRETLCVPQQDATLRALSRQLSELSHVTELDPETEAAILRIGRQFKTLLDGPVQAIMRFPWPSESAEAEAKAFVGRVNDFEKRLRRARGHFGISERDKEFLRSCIEAGSQGAF